MIVQHAARVKQAQQQAPQAPHSPEHAQQASPALTGDDIAFEDCPGYWVFPLTLSKVSMRARRKWLQRKGKKIDQH
jgi:hypothetical protein